MTTNSFYCVSPTPSLQGGRCIFPRSSGTTQGAEKGLESEPVLLEGRLEWEIAVLGRSLQAGHGNRICHRHLSTTACPPRAPATFPLPLASSGAAATLQGGYCSPPLTAGEAEAQRDQAAGPRPHSADVVHRGWESSSKARVRPPPQAQKSSWWVSPGAGVTGILCWRHHCPAVWLWAGGSTSPGLSFLIHTLRRVITSSPEDSCGDE